jgi:hypothetical protein
MSRKTKRRNTSESDSTAGSWLINFVAKMTLAMVVVVVTLSLIQCSIKKPESPTWNTQVVLPLVNRTYSMTEIVDKIDQEGVSFDADSNVIFTAHREIDTVEIDADNLATGNLSYTTFEQVGLVDIPAPTLAPVTLDITLIAGLSTYVPGAVPATSFSINSGIPAASNYTSVGIVNGQAYVIVDNDLGFDITANTVELWDVTYNRSIGTNAFPMPIADGGLDSALFDLSGKTISNNLQARVDANTLGGLVLSTSGKQIVTTMRFVGDLTVGAATAEIPALTRSFTQALSLSESDAIHRATLSAGSLQVSIGNQTNLTALIDVTFPDLTNAGVPLSFTRTVGPISSNQINVNLAGYELQPTDLTVPQEVRVDVEASVPATAPQKVTVSQTQQFIVDANLTGLTFDTVTGIFSTVGTTLSPTQHELDVPDGFGSAELVSAVLTLDIENGVQLPGNLNLTLQGNNGKTLVIDGPVAAATPGGAVLTRFIDSTVADFLSPLPSLITISGNASYGDGVSVGSIQDGDWVRAQVDILAPLEVILPQTLVEPDVESEKIEQDDIDAITDHVVEARFIYNVINRLPVGATINLFLGGDSATVLSDPQVSFIGDIFVVAAPTAGGLTIDTVSTGYQAVIIDNVDVQVLKHDTLYIGTQIILDDSNGLPVKLTASDYLTLIGRVEIDYRFDGEF